MGGSVDQERSKLTLSGLIPWVLVIVFCLCWVGQTMMLDQQHDMIESIADKVCRERGYGRVLYYPMPDVIFCEHGNLSMEPEMEAVNGSTTYYDTHARNRYIPLNDELLD